GNAGLEGVVATDDRLVDLGATGHVVRLHRQHFLQGVRGAIGLERPHLHLAEALATKLRLAAQRLLGDQTVGTDGARMDLVVDKVVQLQQILVADRDLAIERLARAPVIERDLARGVEAGELQHLVDVCLAGTIEHWRSHRHTYAKLLAQRDELLVRQFADAVSLPVDLLNGLFETIQLAALAVLLQRLIDDAPESAAGPAEMRLEDLPDVHARGHA